MLSNAQSKYIRSLTQLKYRRQYKLFTVEGDKMAKEWLSSGLQINMIVSIRDWQEQNDALVKAHPEAELCIADDNMLERIGSLQTPNKVLLVVPQQEQVATIDANDWCIAVDQLQDPGNMGTIIRIADWFGVKHVICTPDSVDYYNPKVVQSAMGGHLRVQLHVRDLESFIKESDMPVYAAVLGGTDVFALPSPDPGILLIGNESKGLHDSLVQLATHKVTIPGKGGAESLNAAVSTGILMAALSHR